jgi:zinc and cadmium transporter
MLLDIILATVMVSLISLVGVALLVLSKKTLDLLLFIIVSFATGALLATAFFDVLPEAVALTDAKAVFTVVLASILSFFVLERIIHWHHEHHLHHEHEKPVGYMVLLGDGLHNFFDGVAISAAFIASPALGIATTLAVITHEIPHELSNFTLLLYAGFSTTKAIVFNLASALVSIVGALAFYYLAGSVQNLEAYGLAFTTGSFIYIACTDLLPELHKEEQMRKSLMQLAAMLAGVLVIWVMTLYLNV